MQGGSGMATLDGTGDRLQDGSARGQPERLLTEPGLGLTGWEARREIYLFLSL